MNTKKVVVTALLAFTVLPIVARAETLQDLLNEVARLNDLVRLLEQQAQLRVSAAPVTTPVAAGSMVTPTCVALTRSFGIGARDALVGGEVSLLQKFLTTTGDYTYGEITGYFGPASETALKRWQARSGIVSSGTADTTGYGYVGPTTRARVRTASCGGAAGAPLSPYIPAPSPGAACVFGGTSIRHGDSVQAYSVSSVPLGTSCATYAQLRHCANGVLSGSATYQYLSCTTPTIQGCMVNNLMLGSGESRTFYAEPVVFNTSGTTCAAQAQVRTCTNGVLSGSSRYIFPACRQSAPRTCAQDGVTVSHGASRAFYSTSAATGTASCASYTQTRTCTDGSLSGDAKYQYAACSAGACTLEGVVVPNGSSTTFYFSNIVSSGELCSSYGVSRTCTNGSLSGSSAYRYPSCSAVSAGGCALDGKVIAHGASATFYDVAAAPAGQTCASNASTRTCTNGVLSAPATYIYSACTENASCTAEGITMAHGSTTTLYNVASVGYGESCASRGISRTCTNGALSGSATYRYGTCVVSPPESCESEGMVIAHGSTTPLYSATTTPYGQTCNARMQMRTCNDGALSGSASFKYSSCSVSPPTSSANPVAQFAAVMSAIEALLERLEWVGR